MIYDNISNAQKIHVGLKSTAQEIWNDLETIYGVTGDAEVTGNNTLVAWIRTFYRTVASEDDDIKRHLIKLKIAWECVNLHNAGDIMISDALYKIVISSSLPPSWKLFTQPYIIETRSAFNDMDSQQFMNILKNEAERRTERLAANHSKRSSSTGDIAYSTKAKASPRKRQRVEETNATGENDELLAVMAGEMVDVAPGRIQLDRKDDELSAVMVDQRVNVAPGGDSLEHGQYS